MIEVGPGGVVGRHPAASRSSSSSIRGSGWVSGGDGEREPIKAGGGRPLGAGRGARVGLGRGHDRARRRGRVARRLTTRSGSSRPATTQSRDRYAEWSQNEVTGSPVVRIPREAPGDALRRRRRPRAGLWKRRAGGPAARSGASVHRRRHLSRAATPRAGASFLQASFVKADYTKLDFPRSSVDAVVALYTFGHVPLDRAPGSPGADRVVARVREGTCWPPPGRERIRTASTSWLGVPMFFSGFDVDTNLRLLSEARPASSSSTRSSARTKATRASPASSGSWRASSLAGPIEGPGHRRVPQTRRRPDFQGSAGSRRPRAPVAFRRRPSQRAENGQHEEAEGEESEERPCHVNRTHERAVFFPGRVPPCRFARSEWSVSGRWERGSRRSRPRPASRPWAAR